MHQQEPAVQQIQQSAEETHRNVEQGNTKLDTAIQSAKNARRWKWYALVIVREYSTCLRRSGRPANLPFQSLLLVSSLVWPWPSPTTTRQRSDLSVPLHPFPPCTTFPGDRRSSASSRLSLSPRYTTPSHFLSCVKAMPFKTLSFVSLPPSCTCMFVYSCSAPNTRWPLMIVTASGLVMSRRMDVYTRLLLSSAPCLALEPM